LSEPIKCPKCDRPVIATEVIDGVTHYTHQQFLGERNSETLDFGTYYHTDIPKDSAK
jgi:hypothetical protein